MELTENMTGDEMKAAIAAAKKSLTPKQIATYGAIRCGSEEWDSMAIERMAANEIIRARKSKPTRESRAIAAILARGGEVL